VDIAFYGDSITELWKYGLPETGGRSNVFWDNFGAYTSAILAVAGRLQTLHILAIDYHVFVFAC
jgi:hypothetical protein